MENTADNQGWPYFKKPIDLVVSAQNSHKYFVYRYADMLLMMADVYNELGDKNKAIDLADEVLARARQSGSEPSDQPARWSASLTKEQVKEKSILNVLWSLPANRGCIRSYEHAERKCLKRHWN